MVEVDEGLPLLFLKELRRREVEGWRELQPTEVTIARVAYLQLAISAVEAVIAEIEAERPSSTYTLKNL